MINNNSNIESIFNWSAKMAERIDEDNYIHTQQQTFARRIEDLPEPKVILGLFRIVNNCVESKDKYLIEKQELNFRRSTIIQMVSCGFNIDYIDHDDHVNFSRWLENGELQTVRIEFE